MTEPAPDTAKRAAGVAAAAIVDDGMRLGLGTGSTVAYFLAALAARGLRVSGVPTSEATADRCRALGLALLDPADAGRLDLCVDGADELDHHLVLTKGGGGALLREKVVASMAERFVVIATVDKLVDRLADTFPLPVEVVPFAVAPVSRWLAARGYEVVRRTKRAGAPGDGSAGAAPYTTDNGNAILDIRRDGGLQDPAAEERAIGALPGVVENGLFVGLADVALLGSDDGGVTELRAG